MAVIIYIVFQLFRLHVNIFMVFAMTLNHVSLPILKCLSVCTNSNFMLCSYLPCGERVKPVSHQTYDRLAMRFLRNF